MIYIISINFQWDPMQILKQNVAVSYVMKRPSTFPLLHYRAHMSVYQCFVKVRVNGPY